MPTRTNRSANNRFPISWIISGSIILIAGIFLVFLGVQNTHKVAPANDVFSLPAPASFGAILPLEGDQSRIGTALKDAAYIALNAINAEGGVRGFEMEAYWKNSGCNAEEAVAALNQLIEEKEIRVVFGGLCPQEAKALAEAAQERGVLLMSPSASLSPFSEGKPLVFRTSVPNNVLQDAAARFFAEELHASRVLIAGESEKVFEIWGAALFEEKFKEQENTDFTAQVVMGESESVYQEKIAPFAESEIDGIYVFAETPQFLSRFTEGAKAAGISVPITAIGNIEWEIIPVTSTTTDTYIIEPFINREDKRVQQFLSQFKDAYGEIPKDIPLRFLANMYTQVFLIRDGFLAVGLDPIRLREFFNGLSQWQGGAFSRLTFNEEGNPLKTIEVKQWKDGAWERVKKY